MTTGPNSASVETPTSMSTPPVTVSHTITPSMRARRSALVALRKSSSYEARTSAADETPTFTTPTSVLCGKSGEDTFITTGYPIFLAARTASAAVAQSSSVDVLMP